MSSIRALLILFIILFNFHSIFAGNENYPVGARSAAMGNATVMMSDLWSIHHNQAGLASIENISVGFHFENKFIFPEYGLQSAAFVFPTKTGVLGLNLSYFGYSKYNETKIGLAYAKTFYDKFSIGIQLDYLNTYIAEGYGNKGTAVFEAGIMTEPVENLYVGAHIYNPTRSKIADYDDERIPTIMRIGLGYNFADKVFLSVETEKDLVNKAIFKAGIEYDFLKNIYLRTGISTNPYQTAFGLGYVFKRLKADIAFSTHQILGITPHISINYVFN